METGEYLDFRTNLFAALWRDVAPLADEKKPAEGGCQHPGSTVA